MLPKLRTEKRPNFPKEKVKIYRKKIIIKKLGIKMTGMSRCNNNIFLPIYRSPSYLFPKPTKPKSNENLCGGRYIRNIFNLFVGLFEIKGSNLMRKKIFLVLFTYFL